MSDKIIARYSSYIIPEYERGDCVYIENELSKFNGRTYKRDPIAFIYDEENKELRIPGGFANKLLAKKLNRELVDDQYPNPSDRINIKMISKPKNETQLKVIKFLCGLGDRFKFSRKHSQLFVDCEPGLGKTFCGISDVAFHKEKAIIFVPGMISSLGPQWKNQFLEHTDITEDKILVAKGSKDCHNILNGKCKDIEIFIFNRSTIRAFVRANGWTDFERMIQKTKAGIKIIDEIHLDFTACMNIDCYSNVKRNIYLSATAFRGNRDEDRIFKKVFDEVPIMGHELRDKKDNYIIIILAKFSHKATSKQRIKCKTKEGLSSALYSGYLINKDDGAKREFFTGLNNTFNMFVTKHKNSEGKVLILGSTKELLQTIKRFLLVNFPQYTVGLYTSDIAKKDERVKELDNDIILATEKGWGTAMHLENLQIMINLVPYSNRVYANQLPGRIRRHLGWSLIYIELLNKDFPEALSQYNNRSKFLCDIAKDCKIITVEV